MSNHKKIDWLRWHKRKAWIRINCAILVALLLIVLLCMGLPIVSDAEGSKIGDYWHMEEILNYEDALSHNGQSGYYDVNSNIFTAPTFYGSKGEVNNYYDKLKAVFDLPLTDFSGIQTNYNMTICKQLNSDNLVIIFDGQSISLNYEGGTYSYIRPPSIYSGSPRYFVFDGTNITSSGYYDGGSYKDISDCDYILFTSMNVNMYYNNADRNLNYLKIENKMGIGSGGFTVPQPLDNSIIDNNYIGENSFMYGDGVSINQWNLIIGLDLNEAQMSQINKYHYTLDCSLQAYYTLAKGITRNQETSLLQSYGLTWASNNRNVITMDFSKTYTDNLSSNYFTIPSSVFNDGLLCDGYTAVPLVNYISTYVPKGSTTNEIQSFFIAMSNVNVGPFSLPGYNETEWFNNCTISYNFSMNVYNENDDLITSLPLAMSYNPMTGQQSNYSNGGGKSQNDVNSTINSYNENKTPSDPDYKNPEDYKPTITPSNSDNSNNNNINNTPSYNNSPSIINNASVTLPEKQTYPQAGVMSGFVKIINGEKLGSVNYVDDIIEGNQYIALCNHALTAVPQAVWDMWILAIKAILGILVSAFFLKILVNWAT